MQFKLNKMITVKNSGALKIKSGGGGGGGNKTFLMHFDGDNGSQTFTNVGTANLPLTVMGSAQVTTSDSQFGGACLAVGNDASNYLAFDNLTQDIKFGTGDFTVECWFKLLGYGAGVGGQDANVMLAFQSELSGETQHFLMYVTGPNDAYPGKFRCLTGVNGNNGWALDMGEAADVSLNEWHHAAVVRYGNDVTLYLDGVRHDGPHPNPTVIASETEINTARYMNVGCFNPGAPGSFNGYIDEMRILVGTAAYTAPFTPPAAPFA
jgi:hypothetical protein